MHHLNDATTKATGSPERMCNCEHTYHFRSYWPSVQYNITLEVYLQYEK